MSNRSVNRKHIQYPPNHQRKKKKKKVDIGTGYSKPYTNHTLADTMQRLHCSGKANGCLTIDSSLLQHVYYSLGIYASTKIMDKYKPLPHESKRVSGRGAYGLKGMQISRGRKHVLTVQA